MTKVLVIIDVQKYFINNLTKDLPEKIRKYLCFQNFGGHIIFTQFINNEKNNFVKLMKWHDMSTSPDIDIADELIAFIRDDNLFVKNGYSIFKERKISNFLENNDIKEIWMCGMNTEQCILVNAVEGFDLGFRPIVLSQLCRSSNSEVQHRLAIENLKEMIGDDQILRYDIEI